MPEKLVDSRGRSYIVTKVITGGSPIYTIAIETLVKARDTEAPSTRLEKLIKGTLNIRGALSKVSYTVAKKMGVDSSPEEDAIAFSKIRGLGAAESLFAYGQLVGVVGKTFTPEEVFVLTNPIFGTETVEYR
jgi:hypothetical protein